MKIRLLLNIVFITALVSCGGAEERKAVYLEKAKSYIEAGALDKARIELKNVLQIDPKDAEVYYILGKVYERQNDYRKAFSHYLKAEELDPDHLANQARLGRIYLLSADGDEKVQSKIDFILSKEPQNAEGLLLKAALKLKQEHKEEAIKIVEGVVASDPGHVDAVLILATLYVRDNKSADAIKLLDNAITLNANNEQLNKLLALVLVTNKDYERAEKLYIKFLERNPDNSANYNNLAAFYNQSGNKVKAEETLRASIDNDPKDADRQLALVRYIKVVKGDGEAINVLRGLIDKNKGLGKLRLALAELLYIDGDKAAAINVYREAINDFSDEVTGVEARISLATVYLRDNNYIKAGEIIDEAVSISANDPKVNFLKGKLAVYEKDFEKAIISLRIVTKETPENVEAFLLLANVYKQEGNEDQARNTLISAYENNKINADGLLMLARYYLDSDINQAEKIIDDYNNIKESDYEGLSIKAAILNKNKKQSEAHKIAETLMEMFPDKPNGYMQAIPFYNVQGEIQKAISVLEKGYLTVKDNRKLLQLLTSLQVSEKQFDIVKKRLNAEIDASPNDYELKILLSKVYIADNNLESADSLLKDVVDAAPTLEEPYLLLFALYQNQNNLTAAQSVLVKGKDAVKSSIKIPLKLAAVYEMQNEPQKAINVYRDLNKSYPDNLVVMNNLASMLSDYSDSKDDLNFAKSLADKLKESSQPVFLDTVGWVYYKLGDYQGAIQYLSQSAEGAPQVNVFNYHLGMAYKAAGDKNRAKIYLEKSLANGDQFKQKDLAEAALKDI